MKIINKFFIAACLFFCLPLTTVLSLENNFKTVGFDSGEIEGVDGPFSAIPEGFEIEEGQGNNGPADKPDGPVEYDPNNPYAEWER